MEIGGQAVIEGVMMKAKSTVATAVRLPTGEIKVKQDEFHSLTKKYKIFSLPIVRGVVGLFEMLSIGMKTLTWSADQQMGEDEAPIKPYELVLTFLTAITLTILFFVAIPFGLASLLDPTRTLQFNVWDGIFRLVMFIGYMAVISLMPDVKHLFRYHGAEHKVINCYEAKKKLTVKNVQSFTTLHPRCGTSFMVVIVAISIALFSFITTPIWYYKLAARILLLPILAGVSFELLKLSAKYSDRTIVKFFTAPGLLMQRITTKEPSDEQVEVAIAATKAVLDAQAA